MNETLIYGFTTKYARTRGLFRCAIIYTPNFNVKGTHVMTFAKGATCTELVVGQTFFLDLETAQERCREQLRREIVKLERRRVQIQKRLAEPIKVVGELFR
jgi:hypothetical protein